MKHLYECGMWRVGRPSTHIPRDTHFSRDAKMKSHAWRLPVMGKSSIGIKERKCEILGLEKCITHQCDSERTFD